MLHEQVPTPTTDELRRQIDSLDEQIVQLWQRRTHIARTIGRMRMDSGGPRIVPQREHEVIARYQGALGQLGRDLAGLVLIAGRGPSQDAGTPPTDGTHHHNHH